MKRFFHETWELIAGFGMALAIYIFLGFALQTDVPLTGIMSGSMEPNYYKGDMLVIAGTGRYTVGDVVVYDTPNQPLPVIHRIITENPDGTFVTKGDNNLMDDIAGNIAPGPISADKIHGKALVKLPLLGWVKVLFMRYVRGFPV